MGDADLATTDDKRRSAVLAFTLPDALRLEITQSLRDHTDLAPHIDARAIYAADGFVDITTLTNKPILAADMLCTVPAKYTDRLPSRPCGALSAIPGHYHASDT